MDVKMYKIMDGERIQASMPANSVDRAMRKGWILEESAQKLEMPAEIIEIMKAKAEPTKSLRCLKTNRMNRSQKNQQLTKKSRWGGLKENDSQK